MATLTKAINKDLFDSILPTFGNPRVHVPVWDEGQKRQNLQQLRRKVQEQMRNEEKACRQIRVRHRRYGEGVLLSENDMMIEAEFPGYGKKQFLKAFGEIEIIER